MDCLVTGGAGFIGSNLVDALLARGDAVTVVDDLSTGRRENLEAALAAGAELVELDIRDRAAVAELAPRRRPEVDLPPGRPDRRPQVGRRPRLRRLDQRRRHGQRARGGARGRSARRFVFISTGGAIYGEGDGQAAAAARGRADRAACSAYGQSKFAAEGYLALYERLYGLSGVSLRLGNVYGPRQDPLGEAGVIAIFCGRLREGGRPTVFGDGKPDPRLHICGRRGRGGCWPRPSRRRPGRSTSAPGSRPTCSSWPPASASSAARELRARAGPGPHRRGAADLDRPGAGGARARLEGRDGPAPRACGSRSTPYLSSVSRIER